jgi:hypothetical protein
MYGEKLQLQMTDTDSFLIYCETENLFNDMKVHAHLYDTSDFPKEHTLHSDSNKRNEEKRAKGISKVAVSKDLRLDNYKHVLFKESQLQSEMILIRNHNHEIYYENIVKTGLSCFDDERYLIYGFSSLAYGQYKIDKH